MNERRPSPWILERVRAVALALGLAAAACGGEPEQEHADDAPHASPASELSAGRVKVPDEVFRQHGLELENATRLRLVPSFHVPAQVAFDGEALVQVGVALSGRVAEVRARLGDEVEAGTELLVVESPALGALQAEYLVRLGVARDAAPAVELARRSHARASALQAGGQGLSLAEVERREAELRVAEAAQRAAEAEAGSVRSRLELAGVGAAALAALEGGGTPDPRLIVRAPSAGRVIERRATLGAPVGPEHGALFVLADPRRLWILADVPGGRLNELAEGARARVLFGIGEEHWCEGEVVYLSPALDPMTRSVRVRIEPREQHAELRPGVFAQAEIESSLGTGEPVVAVRAGALQTLEGATVVFVPAGTPVDGAQSFEPRRVRCGEPVLGYVPVLEGLAEGEPYVSAGSFLLKAELTKPGEGHEH